MKKLITILILFVSLNSKGQTYPIAKRTAMLNEGSIKITNKEVLIKNEFENIAIKITNKNTKRLFSGFKGLIMGVDSINNTYTITIMKNQIHIVANVWNELKGIREDKIIVYSIEGNDESIPEKENNNQTEAIIE